jgi:hypothetical protein
MISEIEKETKQNWQKVWNKCTKVIIMQQFIPNLQDRLKIKIKITPNFSTMVTGHGKTRTYFHRFKIMEQATMEKNNRPSVLSMHITSYTKNSQRMKVLKIGKCPVSKGELTKEHLKYSLHTQIQ